MIKQLLSIFILLCGLALRAQLPNTELWLFKIEANKLKQPVLTASLNITKRDGYDNQPSFSNDDKKIYYVSIRDSSKQADIYYYDLKSKKNIQLTKTQTSEYSPVMSSDGKFITSVVVESDSAQRIHFIDALKAADTLKFDVDSVGYYTFLNADTVVYYKLTAPHSLRYFIKSSGEDKWLGNSPTRTFRTINRHTLLYGLKDSTQVTFYTYDFLLHKAKKYAVYPSLNEDILWQPPFGLIKSEDHRLLRYDEKKNEWFVLFDLSEYCITKITRFAFDSKNKYLVVVDNL
jgi:hypothetical protein